MEPRATYRVQEFARLAGVTVRALHHYEATGLLVPASRTASGHRRYQQDDLLRLQQILTLKHLGFALDDIRALLAAPAYDVQAALRAQQAALEGDIIRLQGVVYALERTAAALEHAQAVDWTEVVAATQALFDADRSARVSRYFPPEQLAWLTQRAAAMPPELVAQGADAWQNLYAAFRQHAHLSPQHPEVQALAAQMDQLIGMFTAGKPEVERGLAALYRDDPNVAASYSAAFDQHTQQFMMQALDIYHAKGEHNAVSDS